MPTSGDLKSGAPLFFSLTTRQIDPAPNVNALGHYNEVLHEVHTIKTRNHSFDARNNLCQ